MHKFLKQRLESLHAAGLTHLPKGTGEYEFGESDAEVASGSTGTATASQEAVSPSEVREPKSNLESPKSDSAKLHPETEHPKSESAPSAAPSVASSAPSAQPVDSRAAAASQSSFSGDYDSTVLGLGQRQTALNVLRDEIAGCTKCAELAGTRIQTVFGVGNPMARLVFVGEAPGANEDRIGEPFVGEAGQLLDKILGACKLSRDEVFILNTVKCRPPANRNPSQSELANCWGFAERQLDLLQPEFICCLGSVAAKTVLKTTQSLGRLRKRFHSYRGSRVLVTYHPAYLLRTPSAKKHVWDDMKMLMKEMGVDLSS